jgi:uncharacterized DUF497 family protein
MSSISYDPDKRTKTLEERGLDFEDASVVFCGTTHTLEDDRRDYGETRLITFGHLNDRMVVLVWTPRDGGRRIISMRRANDDEIERFQASLE